MAFFMKNVIRSRCICLFLLLWSTFVFSQKDPAWDDTRSRFWPADCKVVHFPSSLDGKDQAAYFYRAKSDRPRPLIISLHTWSGNYEQKDTLSWMCVQQDYNYIHPDFRGVNNQPEACGSPLAIRDIDDAIAYAIRNGRVDTTEIHVIGVSGGGHATLLAYMNSRYPVKTFAAWVPISNLVDWYYESVGRRQKYARDLAMVTNPTQTGADDYALNEAEARNRSPIFMDTPVQRRQNSKLYLFTGIHDGYTGSVPITQSLRFYNKVVHDFAPKDSNALISTERMLSLVERRNTQLGHPAALSHGAIHFRKSFAGQVQITVFEGTHELLPEQALDHLAGEKILAIGDSNGALTNSWVAQMADQRFRDQIFNTCISGNTIGFDNLGRRELNTLANVDDYLSQAGARLHGLDRIVILLGTNDCKAVFDDSLALVPQNLEKLINRIKAHPVFRQYRPKLYVVSPPPYAPDEQLIPKYHGGAADIAWLFPRFRQVTEKTACTFVDIYTGLLPRWAEVSEDGIHLKTEGQRWIAEQIIAAWQP